MEVKLNPLGTKKKQENPFLFAFIRVMAVRFVGEGCYVHGCSASILVPKPAAGCPHCSLSSLSLLLQLHSVAALLLLHKGTSTHP